MERSLVFWPCPDSKEGSDRQEQDGNAAEDERSQANRLLKPSFLLGLCSTVESVSIDSAH